MNHKRIKSGFDSLAPIYDFLVKLFFWDAISKTQQHFLSELNNAHSILIFGGGTGDILVDCFQMNPNARYCYVDISAKMIEQTKRKIREQNIEFIEGSYSDIPNEQFDAVITPFVLDCFNEPKLKTEVIPSLKKKLSPNGVWLFCDFNYAKEGLFSRLASRLVIGLLYLFFSVICGLGIYKLPDFEDCFSENDLTARKSKRYLLDMLITTVYAPSKPVIAE